MRVSPISDCRRCREGVFYVKRCRDGVSYFCYRRCCDGVFYVKLCLEMPGRCLLHSLTTGDAVMVSPISDYRRCRDGVSYF